MGTDGSLEQSRLRLDLRDWLPLASTVLAILVAVLWPATPQPLWYHALADCRTLWSIPNFLNVLSNLLFLVGVHWGWR